MKTWRDIEGFFNYPQIYDEGAMRAKNGDTLVEVGSWLGQSMAYLALRLALQNWSGRLVSVDTFKGAEGEPVHVPTVQSHGGSIRQAFEKNMMDCGVRHMIEIKEMESVKAAEQFEDGSCSFVFIDAGHTYKEVLADIIAWTPKMKPGGLMAGHDYHFEEVHRAVGECFASVTYLVAGPCWMKIFPLDMAPADWREAIKRGEKIILEQATPHGAK